MDGSRNGVRGNARSAGGDRSGATLSGMSRGAWYWLGWTCLIGAVLGIFDDGISPGIQFLLIGAGIVAFHLNASRINGTSA